jgi:hypothetical protein
MLKFARLTPFLAGFAFITPAMGTVIVNFEQPTYSAGQDINSGQDGWVRFNAGDGVVMPDFNTGYVPPFYPVLEGNQSFVHYGTGGYGHGWGAASSQVGNAFTFSFLVRTEVNTGTGSFGIYLSQNYAGGLTPGGVELNNTTDKIDIFGKAGTTSAGLSFLPATTYKMEFEVDLFANNCGVFVTDLTNAGARTSAGTSVLYDGPFDVDSFRTNGGFATSRAGGSAVFLDDFRVVQSLPGWKYNASGDWNVAGNWVGGVPNGTSATAAFGSVNSSPTTVYTNTPVTVGTLSFDSPNAYVLAGAGSLTLDAGGTAQVDVLQGAHEINLRTVFASDTNITVASGATLTIGKPMTIKAGKVVAKTGTIIIEAPLTIEANAALSLGAGPAARVFGAPSLGSGAHVDVQNNSMIVDYRGQVSPAATIKSQLTAGYNNGTWNGSGINTSSATATKGLGWRDNAGSEAIEIKYTYYGDTDLSGTVTSTDFNALVAGYGKTSGAIWSEGDFNYDGKVNTMDFNQLAGNFGAPAIPAAPLGAVVPEPASTSLLLGVALMLAKRRRSIHL